MHFLFGSFFIAAIALLGTMQGFFVLAACLGIGLVVSFALKKGARIPVLLQIVQRVERDYEKRLPGKGALLFFLAALVTIILFQRQEIVLGALCVAVYGDAASTIAGLRFGRHRIAGKKTLEGTLGGMAAALFFLLFLFQWPVALAAAAIGMLAELLPFDDNFTIPIITGLALLLLGA
jgi:dolichol kinase